MVVENVFTVSSWKQLEKTPPGALVRNDILKAAQHYLKETIIKTSKTTGK